MITLRFDDVKFKADFAAIITNAKNPREILVNAGREVSNQLRAHFRDKDKSDPNRLSPRRAHFWLQVAQSVNNSYLGKDADGEPQFDEDGQSVVEGNTVTTTINHPAFAQKLFGGEIHAKEAGALTIPEEERAYGRTAATFERETGLKLILIKIGGSTANPFENAVLAVKENDNSKALTVEYLLTKSVDQAADTDALPDKTALEEAIIARGQKVLDRQNQNPTSTTTE